MGVLDGVLVVGDVDGIDVVGDGVGIVVGDGVGDWDGPQMKKCKLSLFS
mgnify:CR=1 FL=1